MLLEAGQVFDKMNELGIRRQAFVFGFDFAVENGFICHPALAYNIGLSFDFQGFGNILNVRHTKGFTEFRKYPVTQPEYEKSFSIVQRHLEAGNSYLVNLTFPTQIEVPASLREIFLRSRARYRLLFQDEFVVFSPEIFVRIENGIIRSFPMKGTIDASIPNAEREILNDFKEISEHNTIVDLIRNDLNMVADDVKVDRFRYIEKINTNQKTLLQVSSQISGNVPGDYRSNLGNIFRKLLPAGSISGAPKKRTLQIIKEAETYERGFYTGVMGYFDGAKLDSGVMIRFIKKENGKLYFYSGGGITVNSDMTTEYNELIDKVYVPVV